MKEKIENYKKYLIRWVREWFDENGKDSNAVIGISGGKDSTVVAGLCVKALGKERVIGVLMPNGVQKDIDDSRAVCEHLGIVSYEIDINGAYSSILDEMKSPHNNIAPSPQTLINLAPRLRMATLYAVSQSMNGRVVGTGNASEIFAGYYTRYGDGANDVNPIANLTTDEVVEIGLSLGLPEYLVKKTPSDGLTGKSDDDSFKERGFSYEHINKYIKHGTCGDTAVDSILEDVEEKNRFKQELGNTPFATVDSLVVQY